MHDGEGHVTKEAEIGGTRLRAKELQGWERRQNLRENHGT